MGFSGFRDVRFLLMELNSAEDCARVAFEISKELAKKDWRAEWIAYHEETDRIMKAQEAWKESVRERDRIDEEERSKKRSLGLEICDRCYGWFPSDGMQKREHYNRGDVFYCQLCVEEAGLSCGICGSPASFRAKYLCLEHESEENRREVKRLIVNKARTKSLGLESTLTLPEWIETIRHFNHLCAYCQVEKFTDMDHFVPVNSSGGTTRNNCVPSCGKCNSKKGDGDALGVFQNASSIAEYLNLR